MVQLRFLRLHSHSASQHLTIACPFNHNSREIRKNATNRVLHFLGDSGGEIGSSYMTVSKNGCEVRPKEQCNPLYTPITFVVLCQLQNNSFYTTIVIHGLATWCQSRPIKRRQGYCNVRTMLCTVMTARYFQLVFPCLSLRWRWRYEWGEAQRSTEGTWSCCPSGMFVWREGETTGTQTSELSWDLCAFCSLSLSIEKQHALTSVWVKNIWVQFLFRTKERDIIILCDSCSICVIVIKTRAI